MTFGQKLKELRQQKGMTQAAFAKASDVPLGTIRDYEQDKREPLLSNAQKLAHALGVSLDVFPLLQSMSLSGVGLQPGSQSAARRTADPNSSAKKSRGGRRKRT
jgi:transcriptional regulator with XRE-family HTH domain